MNRWMRWLRHAWLDETDSRRVCPPAAAERLRARVQASEQRHTGEIRICLEAAVPVGPWWSPAPDAAMPEVLRRRALAWFGELRVWDTEHNNGVLIYLQLAEHAIEIIADRGLNDRVMPAQWQALAEQLRVPLQAGRFEEGLVAAVDAITVWLEAHFPATPGQHNPNELPDAVVWG